MCKIYILCINIANLNEDNNYSHALLPTCSKHCNIYNVEHNYFMQTEMKKDKFIK